MDACPFCGAELVGGVCRDCSQRRLSAGTPPRGFASGAEGWSGSAASYRPRRSWRKRIFIVATVLVLAVAGVLVYQYWAGSAARSIAGADYAAAPSSAVTIRAADLAPEHPAGSIDVLTVTTDRTVLQVTDGQRPALVAGLNTAGEMVWRHLPAEWLSDGETVSSFSCQDGRTQIDCTLLTDRTHITVSLAVGDGAVLDEQRHDLPTLDAGQRVAYFPPDSADVIVWSQIGDGVYQLSRIDPLTHTEKWALPTELAVALDERQWELPPGTDAALLPLASIGIDGKGLVRVYGDGLPRATLLIHLDSGVIETEFGGWYELIATDEQDFVWFSMSDQRDSGTIIRAADGEPLWTAAAQQHLAWGTLSDGSMLSTTLNGDGQPELALVDVRTGQEAWSTALPAAERLGFAHRIDGGFIDPSPGTRVAGQGGNNRVMSAKDGTVTAEFPGKFLYTDAVAAYVLRDGQVEAYTLQTGELAWSVSLSADLDVLASSDRVLPQYLRGDQQSAQIVIDLPERNSIALLPRTG